MTVTDATTHERRAYTDGPQWKRSARGKARGVPQAARSVVLWNNDLRDRPAQREFRSSVRVQSELNSRTLPWDRELWSARP